MSISAVSKDGVVKIEWIYIGEGYSGDYDETDPEDVALMRYDAYIRQAEVEAYGIYADDAGPEDEGWATLHDGSYCTRVPYDTPDAELQRLAQVMADELSNEVGTGTLKRACERLSWIQTGETSQVI